jgi:hypothetical protein
VVFRRLLVIALLALVSVAGVVATTAMANTSAAPAIAADTSPSTAVPNGRAGATPTASGGHGAPCVHQPSCAGGVLLAGATLLVVLPAAGLALRAPAPVAPVVAAPTRLRSALLASKLFRPPRALLTPV